MFQKNDGRLRWKSVLLMLLLFPILSNAQKNGSDAERPKLVVGIMVDQMRWDYLHRYSSRYGEGGFKRLLREGFTCDNTYINYVPTYTAVGHTTVYTGSVPAIHGITGNDWVVRSTGKGTYCTSDEHVHSVGTDNDSGKQSPRNMLVTTVTDELRLATNFRSKVIGIALKDRSSILPAGHFANAAYWYDGESGNFVTSTYYAKDLPAWVKAFNKEKQPEKILKEGWSTLYPADSYLQSIEDYNPYESKFKGTDAPVLPVNTKLILKENGLGLLRSTPFGNTVSLNFAKEAIKNEKMGKNETEATDFLALSLSSPDYIGHQFAINGVEIEDNYLRLDKDLADFLAFLDQEVGEGNYTVFLTADHGAAHNPQFVIDRKGSAGYFDSRGTQKALNALLEREFAVSDLAFSMSNYQVHFDNNKIMEAKIDREELNRVAIDFLRTVEGVAFVTDLNKAAQAAIPELVRERIVNGFNFKRSGDIQIILEPQLFSGSPGGKGTTHGNWHPYDSRIPLIWMGWGIKPGKTNRVINMTDIAPTVSALLNIQEPNGNIGAPITEVLHD